MCGRTLEGAAAFGRGAPYDDLGELLEREQVDVLHVCTPNDVHAEQALAALERGVHVVCEKPLAVSTEESARSRRRGGRARARGRDLLPRPRLSARRADAGRRRGRARLGEVTFVHGRYLCDDVLFPASGWRVDPARSGPSYVVGDLGTHWLDLAEHVTGLHVLEVLAEFRSFAGGPLEDYAALLLRFEGGVVGLARALGRRRRPQEPAAVRVRGHDGRGSTWDQEEPTDAARSAGDGPRQIVVKDPATNAPSARRLSRYPAGHGEGYGGAFRNLFRDVYARDRRASRTTPFPTFADGHRGVALVEAAVASARERRLGARAG